MEKGNLSKWIRGQHEMAIPKGTKTFHNFSSFIRAVGEELSPTVKKLWKGSVKREEVDGEQSLN